MEDRARRKQGALFKDHSVAGVLRVAIFFLVTSSYPLGCPFTALRLFEAREQKPEIAGSVFHGSEQYRANNKRLRNCEGLRLKRQ